MRRMLPGWRSRILTVLSALGMAAGLLLVAAKPADGANVAVAPLAGTWKVTVLQGGTENTLWLVKIAEDAGKPKVSVEAAVAAPLKSEGVEAVRTDARSLHFTIKTSGQTFRFE